ncbi:MAG TPA: MMPL family transporter [Blastocatellia bacterium]|nr:MMPL family transporter [Blastocatellia bacterium]
MTQFAKLIIRHPKAIIAATLMITLAHLAVILIRGISFNGSPETLARKDETFKFYNETRAIFGDDRVIVAGITTTDVFNAAFLRRLDRLTNRLASIDGVDQTISLTNAKAIRRAEGAVRVGPLIGSASLFQGDRGELARLREEVTRDPLYARHYVSVDGRTAAVDVFLKPLDEARTREVAEQVESVAKSEANGDEVFLSGVPIVDARGIRSMLRDMLVLSPIAAVLCFVVFLLAFRTWWGAALPMAALLIGLVWTIGLMSLFGRPITLATLSLPTTLMAVGSSYIFHVLNQYRVSMSPVSSKTQTRSKRAAWLEGLTFIGPAVIVSGTATMAGFGALASSAVPTARDMGIFEALGVLALLVLTVAFIPAALSLLPRHALGKTSKREDYAKSLNKLLSTVTALVLFRRRAVLLGTVAATLVIGAGALRLQVNTDYLRIFPRGSETVSDAEKLHERLAGAATVQLVLTGERGAVTDPQFIHTISELEKFSLTLGGVDAAISVADIIGRINQVLGDSPAHDASGILLDRGRLASIIRDYLSEESLVSRLVSPDGARAVVVLRVNLFSSNELRELSREIQRWAENLPATITVRPTGSIILLNDASDAVAASQASSLAIALVTIYMMMVALFRSFTTGLLALIPNLLPIISYFGFLGWSGTALDITSSLVASAVLGLAVDNAVHMIRRYRQCVAERRTSSRGVGSFQATDEGWAMWLTMIRTGKPMMLANGMLIAAFLVFVLSSFVPVRIAGILWAGGISVCLGSDLIFLPVLMKTRLFARAALGKDL